MKDPRTRSLPRDVVIEQIFVDELRVGDQVVSTSDRPDDDHSTPARRIMLIGRGPRHASITFEDDQVVTAHYLDTWTIQR